MARATTGSTGTETVANGPGLSSSPERKFEPGDNSGRKSATVSRKLSDTLAYPPRLLRSDRAAAYLSMSESHFLKLVGQGRLPKSRRLGRITFWDRVVLDNFVDAYVDEEDETRVDDEWSKMLRGTR
jgi:predicted DNA-binding transcriptional regulator AlpA